MWETESIRVVMRSQSPMGLRPGLWTTSVIPILSGTRWIAHVSQRGMLCLDQNSCLLHLLDNEISHPSSFYCENLSHKRSQSPKSRVCGAWVPTVFNSEFTLSLLQLQFRLSYFRAGATEARLPHFCCAGFESLHSPVSCLYRLGSQG